MSDPSFERSRRVEYCALYFKTKILYGPVNNRGNKPIFPRFLKIF